MLPIGNPVADVFGFFSTGESDLNIEKNIYAEELPEPEIRFKCPDVSMPEAEFMNYIKREIVNIADEKPDILINDDLIYEFFERFVESDCVYPYWFFEDNNIFDDDYVPQNDFEPSNVFDWESIV
jgi:hypothetical protein